MIIRHQNSRDHTEWTSTKVVKVFDDCDGQRVGKSNAVVWTVFSPVEAAQPRHFLGDRQNGEGQ